jgi:hypothetical protein
VTAAIVPVVPHTRFKSHDALHDVATINKTSAITHTHTGDVYWTNTWHVAEEKFNQSQRVNTGAQSLGQFMTQVNDCKKKLMSSGMLRADTVQKTEQKEVSWTDSSVITHVNAAL